MGQVPVVSLAALENPAQQAELEAACRCWGFFHLVDHGLDANQLEQLLGQMRAFFGLPQENKRRIERTEDNPWGYFDRELTKNRRDWKEIFDVGRTEAVGPLAGSVPQWPAGLDGFRDAVMSWYRACEAISFRLLETIKRTRIELF